MEINKKGLQLLQDSFLRERVFGFRELSEEKIVQRMRNLDLHLEGPFYCVVLFAPYLMEKEADLIDRLLLKLLGSVRDEYRRSGMESYTISDNYCNIVGVLSLPSEEAYHKLNKVTRKLTNELIRKYDVDMFVGVGEMVSQISQLNKSKDTAAEALAYKFTFSNDHVISAKDVKRYYSQGTLELKMHYDWVMGCFYDGNLDLMAVRLGNLFAEVSAVSTNSLDSVRNVCIELTASLLRVVREMGVTNSPEINGIYTYIAQMSSEAEIEAWFLNYCAGLLQKVGELRKDKNQQILNQAERYIEENLRDRDLSVQTVSDYVDLSAPYFGNLFYRIKGMHINEYINRARVKEAQRLLTESTEKVAAIAASLGFSSPNYFNSVFKRYTGTTPQRFREMR